MRQAATDTLDSFKGGNFQFKIFESYRSPERQAHLAKKRPRVPRAGPCHTIHQYGLACDFVIDVKGVGGWSTKGEYKDWWGLLHEAGQQFAVLLPAGRDSSFHDDLRPADDRRQRWCRDGGATGGPSWSSSRMTSPPGSERGSSLLTWDE